MNSRPESPPLRDLLAGFADALRARSEADPAGEVAAFSQAIVGEGLPALARLRVYRNNTRAVFAEALGRTYPVVQRRVGDEYFAQLTTAYGHAHPSRRGDLHWVGEAFPAWLEEHLAGSGYEWLADVARLEWACEASLVAAEAPPAPLSALAEIAADRLADTRLVLQSSVRLVTSRFPVWTAWQRNQPKADGAAVDLDAGGEHVLVACDASGLVLHRVPQVDFAFVAALAAGRSLGESVDAAGLAAERLAPVLGWLFESRLVAAVIPPDHGGES